MKTLKAQCTRRLSVLKSLASKSWGADRQVLLNTYKAIIGSKLDYGAFIYGSASGRTLWTLNSIQTTAIRLAIGAFRTSPNMSVLAKGGEPPLTFRQAGLTVTYAPKYEYLPNVPPRQDFYTGLEQRYDERPQIPRPYVIRLEQHPAEFNIRIPTIYPRSIHPGPPWDPPDIDIDFDIALETKRTKTLPQLSTRTSLINSLLINTQTTSKYTRIARLMKINADAV